jgi:hypothetical protein
MRYRDSNSSDLDRARAAVAQWRARNPQGNADQLIAGVVGVFPADYGVVLRSILFALDRHLARVATGLPISRPSLPAPRAVY